MRRYLLDTGSAGDCINHRRGVYEHCRDEVAKGNRIGIGLPVLAELVYCDASVVPCKSWT